MDQKRVVHNIANRLKERKIVNLLGSVERQLNEIFDEVALEIISELLIELQECNIASDSIKLNDFVESFKKKIKENT